MLRKSGRMADISARAARMKIRCSSLSIAAQGDAGAEPA
jgi:hypothetical protein